MGTPLGHLLGAKKSREGLFRVANGGTLFLDEIGEMPLTMQASLLRVLEQRAVRPVGSEKEVNVDVRVVAATNRNLQQEVENGRFRGDLYYLA
ncbi:sigma 54-interacting transcriptional regulator [Vibrio cholerae]